MPPTENENSAGPVIAIIIVLAVIILGGLYFWGERGGLNPAENSGSADETAAITTQSSSDDVNAIEEDLTGTEIDSIGSDLENL